VRPLLTESVDKRLKKLPIRFRQMWVAASTLFIAKVRPAAIEGAMRKAL